MSLSQENIDAISSIVKEAVTVTVNGKIKRIEDKLDEHIIKHSKFVDELKPVAEAVMWINTTKKFVLWFGAIGASVMGILSLSKLSQ